MKLLILGIAGLALTAGPAHAQVFMGQGTAVDGDTLNMGSTVVRLHGIDAPEASQTCNRGGEAWSCGSDAAALLADLLTRGGLVCEQRDTDVYDRVVATCRVGRLDLAAVMADAGFAVALRDFSQAYVANAARAQSQGLGIWASEFQLPADYRAANPRSVVRPVRQEPPQQAYAPARERPSVYYRNCNDARAAGAAPLLRGRPGYRPEMDGDQDGVACEPYRGRR